MNVRYIRMDVVERASAPRGIADRHWLLLYAFPKKKYCYESSTKELISFELPPER